MSFRDKFVVLLRGLVGTTKQENFQSRHTMDDHRGVS